MLVSLVGTYTKRFSLHVFVGKTFSFTFAFSNQNSLSNNNGQKELNNEKHNAIHIK